MLDFTALKPVPKDVLDHWNRGLRFDMKVTLQRFWELRAADFSSPEKCRITNSEKNRGWPCVELISLDAHFLIVLLASGNVNIVTTVNNNGAEVVLHETETFANEEPVIDALDLGLHRIKARWTGETLDQTEIYRPTTEEKKEWFATYQTRITEILQAFWERHVDRFPVNEEPTFSTAPSIWPHLSLGTSKGFFNVQGVEGKFDISLGVPSYSDEGFVVLDHEVVSDLSLARPVLDSLMILAVLNASTKKGERDA